jgi:serine/threonine-protein kinase HipA
MRPDKRSERPERLSVFLGDNKVAELTEDRKSVVWCQYLPETLDRFDRNFPLLSCSLPVLHGRQDATHFFDGLLPEGLRRVAWASKAGIAPHDTFGLLARFGRDVAGALVIAEPGFEPTNPLRAENPLARPLSDDQLEAEVAALPDNPLGIHSDSELSLAGLQDKMLLVRLGDGSWARPIGGFRPRTF